MDTYAYLTKRILEQKANGGLILLAETKFDVKTGAGKCVTGVLRS
jgi:hypothetical protein